MVTWLALIVDKVLALMIGPHDKGIWTFWNRNKQQAFGKDSNILLTEILNVRIKINCTYLN